MQDQQGEANLQLMGDAMQTCSMQEWAEAEDYSPNCNQGAYLAGHLQGLL